MSLELANTLATLGTFVVIAATAIAAILQLRHARTSNQIAALNELRETTETRAFMEASHFVQGVLAAKLQDPAFRYQVAMRSVRTDETRALIAKANLVGNFFESMGTLVKTGLVDKELALQIWDGVTVQAWEHLAPYVAIVRRRAGDVLWEKFEFLTVLAQDWIAAHPKGTYPVGMRRIDLKDEWLDADMEYAASLPRA
jgi:Domain of unknown function (DUF4760)